MANPIAFRQLMKPLPVISACLVTIAPTFLGASETIDQKQRRFFEERIRPVLVESCYECHSADAEKIGAKLLLDTPGQLRAGGESGSPMVAGQPEKSLLIHALRYEDDLEMPPEKPLPENVVADFAKWIEMGAPDPRPTDPDVPAALAERAYGEGDLWSFEPVEDPPPPEVEETSWPSDLVDYFVLAEQESRGLQPAKDADPRVLVRRLHYDLIGLPPSHPEVDRFVENYGKDGREAVGRLVDELLASPHFGERWGRHWLDVARYAESNGNDGLSRNPTFPHAWRYRDYVIDAFNRDLPYDRFLTEQIAGDLLAADSPEERDRLLVATGFLAVGSKPAKAMNKNFEMDVVADQIDVVATGLLGLSVGCARCHDHKFDPIPTRDYYAMAGLFTSTETMWGLAGNEKLTAPPTDLHVLATKPKVPPPADFVETVILRESSTGKPKKIPKPKWDPGTPLAMGVRDREEPADCKINLNGEAEKPGEAVPRGFLTAVDTGNELEIQVDESGRLQLAAWIASPRHPQTARVMVNRVWQHLFGTGIVATPDDFGVYGARPSHPQLLDHLATRFVEEGWSVKALVREIATSRTYQLDSIAVGESREADPENRWLTRHPRRRLDAESLRDGILKASGQLNPEPADGSLVRHRDILVNLAGDLHRPSRHRSVYLCYLRNSPPPELAAFDLPDFLAVEGRREASNVPGQALYLFNNLFVVEQARHFARSLLDEPETDDEAKIRRAFHRVFQRDPAPRELLRSTELLARTEDAPGSKATAWASFAQALFATNEFRYVD
ncbi:MAG: PSD1 and planctomycete cytochrome C domain-containing protein [Verrucomicrobiales bacterium]